MNEQARRDETRKLLKIFGVAVTDFEDEGQQLLERLRKHDGPPDAEVIGTVRQLISAVAETNEKWQQITSHIFAAQKRVLTHVMKELSTMEN